MNRPLQVFCCYARNDQQFLNELKSHLMPLQREKLIGIKADIDINPGAEWEPAIIHHLEKADIILLLISADFIASNYCYEKEMLRAIKRHEQRTARVVPVIIRPTDGENMPFSKLQALPKDANPITTWQNRDEAWTDVANGIRKIIQEWSSSRPTGSQRRISRRAIIIGSGVLAVVGISGSIVGLKVAHSSSGLASPTPTISLTSTIPTPTTSPLKVPYSHSLSPGYQVNNVAWSHDGKYVASANGDNTVLVLDVTSMSIVYTYSSHTSWVNDVTWSPDSKRIASASADGTVQVWDAINGMHPFYHEHFQSVWTVAWSPDGKYIASGLHDSTVQVWDAINGTAIYTYQGHIKGVWSVAWSLDSKRIASASDDGTAQVWDAFDGKHSFIYRGHAGTVYSVNWSPNSQRIASASADGTVQVWDTIDGKHPFTYKGHSSAVHMAKWSPDGSHIASGGEDTTVRIWNAANGSLIYIYKEHSDTVEGLAWSPDGNYIASGSKDGTLRVWQVP